MKFLDNSEKLEILISLSDQLWDDYKKGEIKEKEFISKSDEIRDEINKIHDITFIDLQSLAANFGYMLVKKRNAFHFIHNFNISAN